MPDEASRPFLGSYAIVNVYDDRPVDAQDRSCRGLSKATIEHGVAIDHEPDRCGQIGRNRLQTVGQGQKARPITRSNHSGEGQPHKHGAMLRGALDRFRNAVPGIHQEFDFLPDRTAMMNADGTGQTKLADINM